MMAQADLKWPVVYTGGAVLHYEPADDFGCAYIGGPLDQTFSGVSFGPEPLHRIFTVSLDDLPQPEGHDLNGDLSLFYGMRFDGCELRYRVPVSSGARIQYTQESDSIEILEIDPEESESDWPYVGYPQLLPYVPLREASRMPMAPEEFSDRYPEQGVGRLANDELVVVVPAIMRLGVSIWGRGGDAEGVQLVFRYNYASHEVSAENQCG